MNKKVLALFAVLALIYLGITFAIPPDPTALARYQITALQSRMISLSFVIPIVGIWYAAFYGFSKFRDYAEHIKGSEDGKAFSVLANGLSILAIGLPVSSIVSSTLNFMYRSNPTLIPPGVIFNIYLALAIAVSAYTLLRLGSSYLVKSAKLTVPSSQKMFAWIILIAVGAVYVYLTFQNPYRQTPVPGGRATFYMPDWIIVPTVVVPYLYVWYSGIMAALNINFYQKNVPGIIYKQALKQLAAGIGAVIALSISVQFLGAIGPALINWSLQAVLVLVYVLVLGIAAGYVLIASGAKKLTKIETVI